MVRAFVVIVLSVSLAGAAQDVVSAVRGTITKLDAGTKTMSVKTGDGVEHTFKFVDKTTVHGSETTATGAKDAFHGLREGSDVVAHYTSKGAEDTAVEVDKVGKDGIKSVDGTITPLDRGAKALAVKTADGTERTFRLSDHAATDAGKGIEKGTQNSAKVTVYYKEYAGKKVAHFFQKI